MRVAAVAVNTFRETIRDRILGVIILFALAMIVASLWLASISLGQQDRMIKDFGLVAISLFGLIVAAFVAASLVRKEVEKRTVFIIFSKPVSRSEFIWGKFLGLAATMFTVLAGMTVFLFVLAWVVAKSPSGSLLLAGLLIYLQLLVVVAVTMLFRDHDVGDPGERLGHLRLRRRPAQPQRAVALASGTLGRHARRVGVCLLPCAQPERGRHSCRGSG